MWGASLHRTISETKVTGVTKRFTIHDKWDNQGFPSLYHFYKINIIRVIKSIMIQHNNSKIKEWYFWIQIYVGIYSHKRFISHE